MSDHMNGEGEDYEVGYKKPPKHSQFKKGESGNKGGRKAGKKNATSIMADVLSRKVTVRENGKTRQVEFMEAFVETLIQKALKGSTNEQLKIMKMIEEYTPWALKEPDYPITIRTEYVLPNGKTMEDYGDCSCCGRKLLD